MRQMLVALAAGVVVSFLLEYLLRPRPVPPWRRPGAALGIHLGLWLLVYIAEFATFRRPWFAAANVDALLVALVLVNNAKVDTLREVFVFQDFDYFIDALRHPRLYLPFFGVWRLAAALAIIVGAVVLGSSLEPPATQSALSFTAALALLTLLAVTVLVTSHDRLPAVSHDPSADLRRLGLLASLWRYAADERQAPPALPWVFVSDGTARAEVLPDLIAIQSESFFDPRRPFPIVRSEVLARFDMLKARSEAHGPLQVGAWGANTVRTEFAFLSGVDPRKLGVHSFNPYRHLARQRVPTIATYLRGLGYRTVCLHPYPASFYRRDLVIPALGFDEFMDIRGFAGAAHAGPFVSDRAVADALCKLLRAEGRVQPLLLFAITMENHGPLHLESLDAGEALRYLAVQPPAHCEDLVVYLRHLANADLMFASLVECLEATPRPAGLCIYGDHVPIMAKVYAALGSPDGMTEYLVWRKGAMVQHPQPALSALRVEQLSALWLERMGLMNQRHRSQSSSSTPAA